MKSIFYPLLETLGLCYPVHVVYVTDVEAEAGGLMYSFDVFDIRSLSSKDIFNLPKQCLK